MPEHEQVKLASNVQDALIDSSFLDTSSGQRKLPRRYRAFLLNTDKWIVAILTVVPPFIGIWTLLFVHSKFTDLLVGWTWLTSLYVVLLLTGLIAAIGFVIAGLSIHRQAERSLKEAVDYIVETVQKEDIKKTLVRSPEEI